MLTALKEIKTPYVIILLEDYFLTFCNSESIEKMIESMKSHHVSYAQIATPDRDLSKGKPFEVIPGAVIKPKTEPFRVSLQGCIFKTSFLLTLLKSGESPWEFEKEDTLRSRDFDDIMITILNHPPIQYLNMAHLGCLDSKSIENGKKLGITIPPGILTLDTDHPLKFFWHDRLRPHLGILKSQITYFIKKILGIS